jgi:hypothetical protein
MGVKSAVLRGLSIAHKDLLEFSHQVHARPRVTFMNHSKMNADGRRYVPPSKPYEPLEHREGVKYSTSNEPCEVRMGREQRETRCDACRLWQKDTSQSVCRTFCYERGD